MPGRRLAPRCCSSYAVRWTTANHTPPLRDTVQQGQRTPRIGLIELPEEALREYNSTAHERRGSL
jgi:hypothetical protein